MTKALFEVCAISNQGTDKRRFIEAMGRREFAIIHNLENGKLYIYFQEDDVVNKTMLLNSLPGFDIAERQTEINIAEMHVMSLYKSGESEIKPIKDIISLQNASGIVMLVFVPAADSEIEIFKNDIERQLSEGKTKTTSSTTGSFFGGNRTNISAHMDIFEKTDERKLLTSILEDIDSTMLSGNSVYKLFFAVSEDKQNSISKALAERHILLHEELIKMKGPNPDRLFDVLRTKKSILYGMSHITNFMEVYANRLNYVIETFSESTKGGIKIGTYLKNGVHNTNNEIGIEKSAFNLGFVLSGLPGTGKTSEAMSIIEQIIRSEPSKTRIAIISPTDEWNDFALAHGLHLISINNDSLPINFFSCPNGSADKFCEDLALLISAASNSGPYQNPMEKCLLNAFKRSYRKSGSPNPSKVYNNIEESIIKLHGKISNVGVRYTKHGENIKAALENLRVILNRAEYSVTEGIQISSLLDSGIVFDLSHVSNNIKPYIYALLLNQLYSIAGEFDVYGDDSLRLLIGIEEAQIIFSMNDRKESAAAKDLEKRIQDFRKKGVGIMLIVHSISDIDVGIRRLCQNKLYLKQAPDIAGIAAKDLVFTYSDMDNVIMKLKHLDSRVGAFDFVRKIGSEKISSDSIFVRTSDYNLKRFGANAKEIYERKRIEVEKDNRIKSAFTLLDIRKKGDNLKKISNARIIYLGEIIGSQEIEENRFDVNDLLEGREYILELLGENNRQVYRHKFTAREKIDLLLSNKGLEKYVV